MKKKFLFIDRDGTLIREPKKTYQIDSISKFYLEKDVIYSLLKLIDLDYQLVMITNQDGLGSSSFPIIKFSKIHNLMLNIFSSQKIFFKSILICPHFMHEKCNCRKPNTSLVSYWINNIGLDKKNSYVIGDRNTDIQLAHNMGIKSFLYHSKFFSWKKIVAQLTYPNRVSEISRNTLETKIFIKVSLDFPIKNYINTGISFLDHMLHQIRIHSGIFMYINVIGDLYIDDHHTVEDIGITLGSALKRALGNKIGLSRYGFTLPMDESICSCLLDISGRSFLSFYAIFKNKYVGDLNVCMIEHFFYSLSQSMKITIHLHAFGKNDHHCAESLFKAFGRSLRQAIYLDGHDLPTSKGLL
ncbi:bifunctional histidinol-phosphatase/imidazoleglycerol-phosphate dehydratase HisB [Buchnera aphidicola]|uniref:bifunctional histidinol-phosphatase/imidazoleglycerol-phosphate dehydratase HisB n=1 Tax=Buchnera aphidicola TaxID=9 RepID=UPI001079ACC2|nr:bifunctional histidinol-phosphatase/imidazoleglycerol-phosphate dehydratase HisB [Buchnera aphidicola]VFP79083.1 Histidine biosynthesis bifunctional protein HisB [Buchnera aphidicola (Cinara curtihirsuta)]